MAAKKSKPIAGRKGKKAAKKLAKKR